MMHRLIFLLLLLNACAANAQPVIKLTGEAGSMEQYAAYELQRYLHQITGQLLPIQYKGVTPASGFCLQTTAAAEKKDNMPQLNSLGDQGYRLQTVNGILYLTGNTANGLLYAVYGLLEEHYGAAFYLTGDVLPKRKFFIPQLNQNVKPAMQVRGILPWTNFPQSATVYSWPDWQFIIDQAAKMRLNLINIHNYNGELGHNEMFHNFEANGHLSRVWMATARTGHGWACPPFDVTQFRFGAAQLFDDYDVGADCALHNETLDNKTVLAKGVSLFQRVIDYAHSRGVKMALGIDIDLVLPEYGLPAHHPQVIEARTAQLLNDYPNLDYLILYISETIVNQPEKLLTWKEIFNGMYQRIRAQNANMRIAVSGWGLSKEIADALPPDVIAAPISAYSDAFEDGSIYGNREYWGCPWMERDFFSSEYYYPYGMHLSNTIKAWQRRAANMTGLQTLTWRIGDAVEPKISFIAKAPWYPVERYPDAASVYQEYAQINYGAAAAKDVTAIINENEPLSCTDAECQPTSAFTGKPLEESGYLLNIRGFQLQSGNEKKQLFLAHQYDTIHKAAIEKRTDADTCVAFVQNGAFTGYRNVMLDGDEDSIRFFAATTNEMAAIEVRLDSITGPVVAARNLYNTGGWHQWKTLPAKFSATKGRHNIYLRFYSWVRQADELAKADKQMALVKKHIQQATDADQQRRMSYLLNRLLATKTHLLLSQHFPAVNNTSELSHLFAIWVKAFTHRVNDISSLGNVQSIQNRYVQERYLAKENELQKKSLLRFPVHVRASGTAIGAQVQWQRPGNDVTGYSVYANGKKINGPPVPATDTSFFHAGHGQYNYQVTALYASGGESQPSAVAACAAGNADAHAPFIALISPPQSAWQYETKSIKVRLLDNRSAGLGAVLYYRKAGTTKWNSKQLIARTPHVFAGELATHSGGTIEYYIWCTDGKNKAQYPATPGKYLTYTVLPAAAPNNTVATAGVDVQGKVLNWQRANEGISYIKVYRSKQPKATWNEADYLTYLPANRTSFEDNGWDLTGKKLTGMWYYKIAFVFDNGRQVWGPDVARVVY